MNILNTIIPFIVVLGAMIFVHELGHFLVAKFFKIKVEVFSLGFGPRLLGFRLGDTDYRISAIPLGGYVKMKGENLDEQLDYAGDEFLAKPKWQRLLVLFAGPFMNIVTAIAIPAAMMMYSYQEPKYRTEPAVVGSIVQGSAAAEAGIQPGDRIVKIDNKENPTWREVELKTDINPDIPLPVVVDRNGQQIQTTLKPKIQYFDREKIGVSGLLPQFNPNPVVVDAVVDGGPAKQAGLASGDKIVKFNGEEVKNFIWLQASLQNQDDKEVAVTVDRGGEMVDLKMKPKMDADGRVRVGFSPNRNY